MNGLGLLDKAISAAFSYTPRTSINTVRISQMSKYMKLNLVFLNQNLSCHGNSVDPGWMASEEAILIRICTFATQILNF